MWSRVVVAAVLAALASPGSVCAQAQGAPALSGLELSADKTDIERLRIPLEQPFSAGRHDYSVTVDASYTAHVLITATRSAAGGSRLTINGTPAASGEPHDVQLAPGTNTFVVDVPRPDGGAGATYRLVVTQKDLSKQYWSESLGNGVWRIQDFGGSVGSEDMYLFEGATRALLFDTGMGRGDLAAYVRSLTKLPVDVAITHGNRDHFLQVDQFPDATVYMSDKDVTRLPPALVTPRFKWIRGGDIIDIGAGRRFEVIEVPGHSLGSVLYVDFASKVAITGDAVSSGSMVYMFAPTCTALDVYLAGLRGLEARIRPLGGLTLLVGHHYQEKTPLRGAAGKQLITDMRTAAEQVLGGQLEGRPARTTRDGRTVELRQASVGLAGLWYNPANLVTSPAALGFLDVRTAAGQPVVPRPVFSSFQTSYTATVGRAVETVSLVPTAHDPQRARITIGGRPVASGAAFSVALERQETRLDITVTAADDVVRTYTVVITKGP